MTDDRNNGMETINTTEIEEAPKEEPPIDEDIDEADSIQKPPKKKGRPPLSQKQKDNLAKGRAISRRNMQKRMAEEKLRKIEAEETNKPIENLKNDNKKKAKKKVIIESESSDDDDDSSEDEIVYVSKKKKKKPKKKPKKKIIIESSSSDDDDDSSDEEYPPQPPQPPVPRLIFR